jgi:hypothetical protein
MLLWFVTTAMLTVWSVFRDQAFDYRLLVVGSLLPDLIDLPGGRARWAHSLVVAVAMLVVVMAVTAGRKPVRRMLLGLPIGVLLHLVFDGVFTNASLFWWPFLGGWEDAEVPSLARGWWSVILEAIGVWLAWWMWRRFALHDAANRATLVRRGRLVDHRDGP